MNSLDRASSSNIPARCLATRRFSPVLRWTLLLVVLTCHLNCSSYEFGVFTQIVNPPTLIARLNCDRPGEPIFLEPTALVSVTSGSQGYGIVQLHRVVMEYCVNAVVAQQTSELTPISSRDACEAVVEVIQPVHQQDSLPNQPTDEDSLSPCTQFYKKSCLASLRFPNILSCAPPRQGQRREDSACFVDRNQTLSYQGDTSIPLQSLQQLGYTPRSNQTWGQICCEVASQECQADNECNNRGTCTGRCQHTDQVCTANQDCPARPQKCLSLCDDLFQHCTNSTECPRPIIGRQDLPGTCGRRCNISGDSCNADADCPAVAQTCLRYCSNVGNTCTQDQQCARGESCMQVCNRAHTQCSADNDCPAGEQCQRLCLPSAQLLVYVGFDSDPETSYARYASPRQMRLFCRGQGGPFRLDQVCKTPQNPSDPPATVCPQ